ncbi:16850_t:CDS:2 [Acaulospora colombiana]|uniref:16850_t:CDS:1 n=1 Tax=Acaulospora colombiana TaxID=27376 RepID=A0ACA9JY00_9GLOM|nr:16850_t:CDS:2 [Acaulospora colombiana]
MNNSPVYLRQLQGGFLFAEFVTDIKIVLLALLFKNFYLGKHATNNSVVFGVVPTKAKVAYHCPTARS